MASCIVCGTRAGIGKNICDTCSLNAAEADAHSAEDRHVREQQLRRTEARSRYLGASRAKMQASLDAGLPVWLYKSTYIHVDAQMDGLNDPMGIDMRALNEAGLSGWEVVAVVPRTFSGSQSYFANSTMTMRDLGGQRTEHRVGLSGNVIGAYLLQRLQVTAQSLVLMGDEIDQVILQNHAP